MAAADGTAATDIAAAGPAAADFAATVPRRAYASAVTSNGESAGTAGLPLARLSAGDSASAATMSAAGVGSATRVGADSTARPMAPTAVAARGRTAEVDGAPDRWGVGLDEAAPRADRDEDGLAAVDCPAEGVSDPAVGASAHATADPAKAAAPTPRATASPPTRPMKMLAATAPPS